MRALLLLLLLAACGAPPATHVLIDGKDPAYVVFTPVNPSETLIRRITAESREPGNPRLVSWDAFPAAVREEAARVVVRDDYPGEKVAAGIACLMAKAPGPWGITWNNGVALTRNDYDFAKRSFADKRPPGTGWPIDPKAHLPAFGCR